MFEKMSEKEARDKILGEVAEYAQRFHPSEKPYEQGGRINYAGRYYDGNEIFGNQKIAIICPLYLKDVPGYPWYEWQTTAD